MAKPASLTAGLVTVKGQATPAVTHDDTPPATEEPKGTKKTNGEKLWALTVKLDRPRYEALKNLGLKLDKKSQTIFVEALDLWIAKQQ